MKIPVLILLLSTCLLAVGEEELQPLSTEAIWEDSSTWPAFVHLDERTEFPGGKVVETWQRGVLIRLEMDEADGTVYALADFGREGTRRIEISKTDLPEAAAAIRAGQADKAGANYLLMLGPPKLFHPRDGLNVAVTAQEADKWEHLLFLYVPDSALDWNSLEAMLERNIELLKDHSTKPILLPLDPYSDGEIFVPMVERDLDVAVLHNFLCRGFIHSLHHYPGSEPLMVLTDMNGKILAESRDWSASGLAELFPLSQ